MLLDLRTIYVVSAVTCLVLGAVQILAYASGRFDQWPKWWGLSNILLGFGWFGISFRGVLPDVVTVEIANITTLGGYMALLIAMRVFSGERVNLRPYWLAMLLASMPIIFTLSDPASYLVRIAYLSGIFACFDIAVMLEGVRLARREKLVSAWILVGLFAPTTLLYAVRSVMALTGYLGGQTAFENVGGITQWMAVASTVFVALRGITIVLMASERSHNSLRQLAHTDPLTGAFNRGGLHDSFLTLARDASPAAPVSVLLFDIDHFKTLNDTHGHAAGDGILRLFAAIARSQLHVEDILARQGGDEFVAVLKGKSGAEAVETAERLRQAFADAVAKQPGLRAFPTLSIGVAERREKGERLESILLKADEALYRSKRSGRNRVAFHGKLKKAA